jgi:Uma2 family endonuclease
VRPWNHPPHDLDFVATVLPSLLRRAVGLSEPDVVLLRPKDDFYASKHPAPADILLIVEVADSSLKFDAGTRARLYAESGIPGYWIVDIPNVCLHAYSDVHERAYRTIRQFHIARLLHRNPHAVTVNNRDHLPRLNSTRMLANPMLFS